MSEYIVFKLMNYVEALTVVVLSVVLPIAIMMFLATVLMILGESHDK